MRLIILAAGRGTRLAPLTDDRPKCLVSLAGRTLLERQVAVAREVGIRDIVVVGGHRADRLRGKGGRVLRNLDYQTTNMVRTLFCARHEFGRSFIMAYGDIVYTAGVLKAARDSEAAVGVVVDRDWRPYWEDRFGDPLSDAESLQIGEGGRITSIGQPVGRLDDIQAQYIGLVAFRETGVVALKAAYRQAGRQDAAGRLPFGGTRTLNALYMTDLLQGMIDLGTAVTAIPVRRGWVEIDSHRDLALAEELVAAGQLA